MVDDDGNTPLHTASTVEEARNLLDHGADINAKNHQGCTPLMVGIMMLNIELGSVGY